MASEITLEFNNVMASIKNEVQAVLHGNIEKFKDIVSKEVHSSVYTAYSSARYERRGDSGGLSDVNNYEVEEGNLSLTLTNKTESGTNYWKYSYSVPITEIVENGTGDGWVGVPARPFMENALDEFAYGILEPQINALGGD